MANPRFPWHVSTKELFSGRKGGPFNIENKRDYTRRFRVIVNDVRVGPIHVCSAPRIPKIYSPYVTDFSDEYDENALAVSIKGQQEHEDDWQSWIVETDYSTQVPVTGQPGGKDNPEDDPPEIEWDFEILNRAMLVDRKGKSIINSANQQFQPAPGIEVGVPVFCMTRNELDYDYTTAASYAFAVNTDNFMGATPGRAQCLPPKAKAMFRGALRYWKVSYRIRFFTVLNDPNETWQLKLLDQGLCQLQLVNGRPFRGCPIPIMGPGGPITQPVLLDGAGRRAGVRVFGLQVAPALPVYLKFDVYNTRSFKDLITSGLGPRGV